MVTKVEAARIATGSGIPVVLTAAAQAAAALAGERVGTFFHPDGRARRPGCSGWPTPPPRGRLHLDAGAVEAVVDRRKSLLPAGITAVDGAFTAGDPVDLVDAAGRRSPAGWSTTTRSSCPGCSAAPPASSPRRSARRTNERSSTATTSSCCEPRMLRSDDEHVGVEGMDTA